jgi:hypothetical protein
MDDSELCYYSHLIYFGALFALFIHLELHLLLTEISAFRRTVDEVLALLGCYI